MRRVLTVLPVFLCVFIGIVSAELRNLTPDEKKEIATDILTGEVKAIYQAERTRNALVDTIYVLEIAVSKVDKGSSAKKGEVAFVKTWRKKTRPDKWVGPSGQQWLPTVGDPVQLFAKREADGTLQILLPNGIEKAEDLKK